MKKPPFSVLQVRTICVLLLNTTVRYRQAHETTYSGETTATNRNSLSLCDDEHHRGLRTLNKHSTSTRIHSVSVCRGVRTILSHTPKRSMYGYICHCPLIFHPSTPRQLPARSTLATTNVSPTQLRAKGDTGEEANSQPAKRIDGVGGAGSTALMLVAMLLVLKGLFLPEEIR